MTTQYPTRNTENSARPLRSIAAVVIGFFAVFILSLGTDQILHVLKIYPPWDQPLYDTGLLLLATGYRCLYTIFGSYLTARLAPRNPMRHLIVLGGIGLVMSLLGLAGAMVKEMGPVWYPIALVVTTVPCIWLGGIFYKMQTRQHDAAVDF